MVRAKKSLGQNFLMHARIAERIVHVAQVGKGDTVLEIGPGTGMLTRALLACARNVVAVEADATLVEQLEETFAKEIAEKRLELIHGDIRTFGTKKLGTYTLVANIPYYITGEIIRMFLENVNKPASMTLLVQKEVAVRIARSKKESLLSLSVKAYGTPVYQFTVPRGAFNPAPNVDSAVLSITNIASPFKDTKQEKTFFTILHAGFAHKRKLLARNLETIASRSDILSACASVGIPEKARAEDVSLSAWLSLSQKLRTH